MKFSTYKFTISNSYEQELHERQTIFEEAEKMDETVVHTFVTTYGVKDGIHPSNVHSEISMQDLFAK